MVLPPTLTIKVSAHAEAIRPESWTIIYQDMVRRAFQGTYDDEKQGTHERGRGRGEEAKCGDTNLRNSISRARIQEAD